MQCKKIHFILIFEQEKWLFYFMIFKFKGSWTIENTFELDFLGSTLICIFFVYDKVNFKGQ